MKRINALVKVYIAKSKIANAGRGVFASKNISKGEIIENVPAFVLPKKDYPLLKKTKLLDYYFIWNKQENQVAVALGFGSIYNHSHKPNATYKKNFKESLVKFVAIKDIKKGDEITVNYNYGNPNDINPLWIKDIPKTK